MKNKIASGLLIITLVTASGVQGQPFLWKRNLQPQLSSGWHNATLPAELVAKTKPGFADMRIYAFAGNGYTTEVPYIVETPSSRKPVEKKAFKLLNRSERNGRFYYTLEQAGGMSTLNEIELGFAEKNFDLGITLEGSMNQEEWFLLLKDYRVTGIQNSRADFSFTTLSTEFANYRYYRIHYAAKRNPVVTDATYCISMKGSEGAWWEKKAVVERTENLKKEKQSVYYLSLAEPFPVSLIRFYVKDSIDFIRPVNISAIPWPDNRTGTAEEKYISMQSVTLNSFDLQQVELSPQLTKQLKITISNDDNVPLTIDSIVLKSEKQLLITRIPEGEKYIMVYGNNDLFEPAYDLAGVLAKSELPDFGNMVIGPEEKNSPAPTPNWWEHNFWLYGLMGAIILLLGWFTLKMMKKNTGDSTN